MEHLALVDRLRSPGVPGKSTQRMTKLPGHRNVSVFLVPHESGKHDFPTARGQSWDALLHNQWHNFVSKNILQTTEIIPALKYTWGNEPTNSFNKQPLQSFLIKAYVFWTWPRKHITLLLGIWRKFTRHNISTNLWSHHFKRYMSCYLSRSVSLFLSSLCS